MEGTASMAIDGDEEPRSSGQEQPKKSMKRKRGSLTSVAQILGLGSDEKRAKIEELEREMKGLFGYYRQVMEEKAGFGLGFELGSTECGGSVNGMVTLLIEESDLSLSRLVEEVHGKLAGAKVNATAAAVKTAVLFVGQRMMYGVPNVDADVLEDETQTCLWCWETRDLKLVPKSIRGPLKIRRTCRRKIQERITAVSAMITALQKSEVDQDYENDLVIASEKLGKVLREAEIRLLVDSMLEKVDTATAGKDAKREEKLLIKQMEKNKREAEKEKKKTDLELQKEKRRTEKEQKRKQEEAEKDEKRREKEELEMRRQQRKQQDEAEKEQRRREKEEAELKKKMAIQKQASIMERFLKRSKTTSPSESGYASSESTTPSPSIQKSEKLPEAVTLSIDYALSSSGDITTTDIFKSHLSSWHHLGRSIRLGCKEHWSVRRKPKTELFRKLKLTATKELVHCDGSSVEKLVSNWEERTSDDKPCFENSEGSSDIKKSKQRRQLLQFDKSPRPAFYGIWPKKSQLVGPRHPFRKDPDLDYDVDSDEEWEEEEPGESLSDCDKDDEEENLEEGCIKADEEEESEDGFFVPDGYFSEDEGVQIDRMETDLSEEARCSPGTKSDHESEEFSALLRQQKYLNDLTHKALRKVQPLVIINLMHEKNQGVMTEDRKSTSELEIKCLQALSMRAFPGATQIEITIDCMVAEDQDPLLSNGKNSNTPISSMTAFEDSDMPTVVSTIQSCPQSLGKVMEALQQKFPSVSKTQLRSKVREISDFVDNRWQVKKEILHEFGMPVSPEKRTGRSQNIASFFSKRCLPPADKRVNPTETSPQDPLRQGSVVDGQQRCTSNPQ
ncbi:hypothetical protein Tsubulata_043587 [Turnera subulata]|uniref:Chromatin assembly factor 1 subunit FAS1 n=1 Tax=Turnera subulata TaxID=218843 RepID=A0A9Q0F679_9ROSI|nr:hypothetical protein Tsubulata_043587 [Turnera subulata]